MRNGKKEKARVREKKEERERNHARESFFYRHRFENRFNPSISNLHPSPILIIFPSS